MNIVYFVADGILEYNSSHFRVSLQANALKKSGLANVEIINVKEWLKQTMMARNSCSKADIIVIQRVMIAESVQNAIYWINKGKKVVVDWDDAYDLIGEENAAYKFWGLGEVEVTMAGGYKYKKTLDTHPVDDFKNGLNKVSCGTMPSYQLVKDWSKFAPCYYIPNYLDTARYHAAITPSNNNGKITIGWGGSLSHLTSFSGSGVQDALQRILNKHKNVELLIVGDERVVDQLPFSGKQLKFLNYVMWYQWPSILNLYDIGIAPLAMPYDARRSGLKTTEYIAMGIPFVATKGMPYTDLLKCKSGIYINQGDSDKLDEPNEQGWFDALDEIISNYSDFCTIAKKEQNRYHNIYDADENAKNIAAIYESILNNV